MNEFADAFANFDALVHLDEAVSVYLVANNPNLVIEKIKSIINPEKDYVCQFNKCIFADQLNPIAQRFIFFFSTNEYGIPHGFDWNGVPERKSPPFPEEAIGFILRYREAPIPPFQKDRSVHTLPDLVLPVIEADTATQALASFPPQHLPSAGFIASALLFLVNTVRIAQGRPPHRIVLAGFTGEYKSGAPFVHDFRFEQSVYRRTPFVTSFESNWHEETCSETTYSEIDTLRGRFSRDYDFTAATKAQILTDISETFYRAGDMAAFQRIINAAISVNPSVAARQIALLIRSMVAQDQKEFPSPYLLSIGERAQARSQEVNEKWKLGKINWVPVKEPDIASVNCEYRLKRNDAPRVVVLNETSKIGFNDKHLGCHHVSRTTADMLNRYGMEYAGWANNIAGLNQILEADPSRAFDAVIINGEGTFHGNAARAIELAMMGQYAKTIGKKVFLINSVWERNGTHLEELCQNFDLITVRDSWSLKEANRLSSDVILIPDLTWNFIAPLPVEKTREIAVIDSILPDTCELLENLALQNSCEFRTMSGLLRPFARAVQREYPSRSIPAALSENDLQQFGAWVSGRFHGSILALLHHSPVVAFQSNTSKIQAMLEDIGISEKLCRMEDIQHSLQAGYFSDALREKLEYTKRSWESVTNYRAFAVNETEKLFGQIRQSI